MKKLYIFDMGGVLVQNVNILPDLTAYLGITLEEGRTWGRDLFFALMEGKMSTREFWTAFSQRSGLTVEEDDLFGRFFHPVLDELMYYLVLELKKLNRVVCGTNTIEEHYATLAERGDYNVFDAVYASHQIGFAKPRPEFYCYIIEQENIPPSQTVFIDDNLENIEAAKNLGIYSFHFTEYERLIEQLGLFNMKKS
jgi:HAD superfamily hydrolase (TIGR01509 family)